MKAYEAKDAVFGNKEYEELTQPQYDIKSKPIGEGKFIEEKVPHGQDRS